MDEDDLLRGRSEGRDIFSYFFKLVEFNLVFLGFEIVLLFFSRVIVFCYDTGIIWVI